MTKPTWGTTVEAQEYQVPVRSWASSRWYELGGDVTNRQAALDRSVHQTPTGPMHVGVIGTVFVGFYPSRDLGYQDELRAAADEAGELADAQLRLIARTTELDGQRLAATSAQLRHQDEWLDATCQDGHAPGAHTGNLATCRWYNAADEWLRGRLAAEQLASCVRAHLGVSHAKWLSSVGGASHDQP